MKSHKRDKSLKKAVLPAAGLGTRFLPATKASPKEMLPIVDKPLIQYAVEEAVRAGLDEFIIITAKNKRSIEDHFDSAYELEEKLKSAGKEKLLKDVSRLNKMNFAYIRQRAALGLGHAVLCAKPFVGSEPFAVILSDDLLEKDCNLLAEMINIYKETKCPVIALEEVPISEVHRYGIIDGDFTGNVYRINDLVEKPEPSMSPSNLAIIGRYILTPDIFDILEKQKPGVGGEIQLTDALKKIAGKMPIYGYPIRCKRYDAGEKLGYLKAVVDFALSNAELSQRFKQYLIDRVETLR